MVYSSANRTTLEFVKKKEIQNEKEEVVQSMLLFDAQGNLSLPR